MDFNISFYSDQLGVLIGWAIITHENNQPYFDSDDDHVTDSAVLEAVVDFMVDNTRASGTMHLEREDQSLIVTGKVIAMYPLTREIAQALNIDTGGRYGAVALVRALPWVIDAYKKGLITGFSFGGDADESNIQLVEGVG